MKKNGAAQKVAFLGILFALATVLSWLESLLPSPGIPGIKLGLSNIATMYCLFFFGPLPALILAALKSGFVLMTRGAVAAILSASGGLCSVVVMSVMIRIRAGIGMTGVAAAIAHNAGQLLAAALILRSSYALYYIPVLTLSGIAMGLITSSLLKSLLPVLSRWNPEPRGNPKGRLD